MTRRRDPILADLTARALFGRVRRLGYHVSVHLLPSSLLGTVPACVELHAVVVATGEQHVAKAAADEPDAEYRCACALAEMVGVRVEGRATAGEENGIPAKFLAGA
jgi:hypothetical protein